MLVQEWREGDYLVSTDLKKLDIACIHFELSHSYWAEKISRHLVEKSIQNSLCFGAYHAASGTLVGFGRVVSDFATFAYLGDVFVLSEHRGRGISKFLMQCIMKHPELQGLRRFCLGTKDAHTLYQRFGFKVVKEPNNWMEINVEDIYLQKPSVPM
ncbi:MAG: GNAT family N-acetyltransferase [Gammaproteobacteria bacterium]|nr:GNAT family N-acetyltransferase [Gammaproteobacteria bacterium]